jgi:hypothetical protein
VFGLLAPKLRLLHRQRAHHHLPPVLVAVDHGLEAVEVLSQSLAVAVQVVRKAT